MIIKTASYRGLSEGKNCGSHYKNFSCSVDVTCYLKRHCDGRRECNVTVDDDLFLPSNVCAGLNKYLYFEYQCSNNMTSFNESCHSKLMKFGKLFFQSCLSVKCPFISKQVIESIISFLHERFVVQTLKIPFI